MPEKDSRISFQITVETRILVILWPLKGQKWAMVVQNLFISEHWLVFQIMLGNHHFKSFFWPLECQDWAKVAPKQHPKNTHSTSVYTKFEVNWVKTSWDNARKPRTHGRTDAQHSYAPTDEVGRDNDWHQLINSRWCRWSGAQPSDQPAPHSVRHSTWMDGTSTSYGALMEYIHDDVIKWKHFPRNWPFARGIHRSTVDSPHKGQWRGALMFSLISAWTNGWANIRDAGDLRRHCAHYEVTVMFLKPHSSILKERHLRPLDMFYWSLIYVHFVISINKSFIGPL